MKHGVLYGRARLYETRGVIREARLYETRGVIREGAVV